jgi:hypothetical protein
LDRRQFLLTLPPVLRPHTVADPPELVFDGDSPRESIRALHGINGGLLAAGGILDLSDRWKEAAFPLARLYDCHWPNPDLVDVRAVFLDPHGDPARPESYDFDRTDEYVNAIDDCGAAIV